MNWQDEQFIKVYTRDTGEWTLLSWDAQALLLQILRKVDRSGVLQLGKHGARVLPAALGHREQADRITAALVELTADGCVVLRPDCLVVPNFIAAQTSRQSDKARQQSARDRRRAESMGASLPSESETSQNVTDCHLASHAVTQSHLESPRVTLDKIRLDEKREDLSCAKPEQPQPELALVPQQAADTSKASSKPSKAQIRNQVALGLFAELVAARMSVIAGAEQLQPRPAALAGLKACLGQDYTPDQIRHVIRLKVAEVKADPVQAKWFVPTWFRPANVERYLALRPQDVTSARPSNASGYQGRPAPNEPPKSPRAGESDFQRQIRESRERGEIT